MFTREVPTGRPVRVPTRPAPWPAPRRLRAARTDDPSDLARLRELPAGGRGELVDAVRTVLAQGEPYGRGGMMPDQACLARHLEVVRGGRLAAGRLDFAAGHVPAGDVRLGGDASSGTPPRRAGGRLG
ncbi:DUF5682 family protein [Streptomyces sp. NPDC052015]|uniref:DUF5682 family protein n=1 Tax=Streptomyces sp. NPDC052015 TaxID=3154755 RepID=UPI00344916C8